MANDAEASTSRTLGDHERESQDIVIPNYLPPRLREIYGSSESRERFDSLNSDLLSERILPAMERHLRHHILTESPGTVAQTFRTSLGNPLQWPRSASPRPALLFGILGPRQYGDTPRINKLIFYDCALRDKRLAPLPLPNQIWERSAALPRIMRAPYRLVKDRSKQNPPAFLEAVGQKVVYWTKYNPSKPFTYIMSADHNADWTFRTLDTSAICREIRAQGQTLGAPTLFMKAICGDRLIVLLEFKFPPDQEERLQTLALDVNTERWSLLPPCPLSSSFEFLTTFSWKGNLHFYNCIPCIFPIGMHFNFIFPIEMHFNFENNLWVLDGSEVLGYELPLFLERTYRISSRSGTRFFVTDNFMGSRGPDRFFIRSVNELTGGLSPVHLPTNVLAEPIYPVSLERLKELGHVKLWEVNTQDILMAFVTCHGQQRLKYSWWIFNEHDGVKSYGDGDFDVVGEAFLYGRYPPSILKIES